MKSCGRDGSVEYFVLSFHTILGYLLLFLYGDKKQRCEVFVCVMRLFCEEKFFTPFDVEAMRNVCQ